MSEQEPLPRHALPPAPLTRFVNDPDSRERLKNILREPAFIAAINFLQEQDRIQKHELTSLPDLVLSRKAAFHASTASIYERLQDLSKLAPSAPEVEAWDHINNQ